MVMHEIKIPPALVSYSIERVHHSLRLSLSIGLSDKVKFAPIIGRSNSKKGGCWNGP